MRRRIKLSKLNRIISESVSRVLNELDWKTYQNATNKWVDTWRNAKNGDQQAINKMKKYMKRNNLSSIGMAGSRRLSNFLDARNDEFDANYGYGTYKKQPYQHYSIGSTTKDIETDAADVDSNGNLIHARYVNGEPKSSGTYSKERKFDDNFLNAIKRGNQEVSDYKNGNYDYVKGKGWVRI